MFQNKIFQQLPKVKYVTAKKLISKTSKKPKEVNQDNDRFKSQVPNQFITTDAILTMYRRSYSFHS